jgi:hypothetical protein
MSETHTRRRADIAICSEGGPEARLRAGDCLCLAATPIFGIMTLLSVIASGSAPDVLCSAAQHISWLGGMAPMYALMSAFHAAPWLRLMGGRGDAQPTRPWKASRPGSRPAAIVASRPR